MGGAKGDPKLLRLTRAFAVVLLIGLVGAVILSPSASAHLPEFEAGGESYESAQQIGDILVSQVFYGDLPYMELGDPEGARYFSFEAEEGDEFSFQIGVRPGDLVYPRVLLTGPGLPEPMGDAASIIESTGVSVPDGHGALGWETFPYGAPPPYIMILQRILFEPFTQTTYVITSQGNASLPATGIYNIIVMGVGVSELTEPLSTVYFIATGFEEEFGVIDFALLSWYWLMVHVQWGEPFGAHFLWPTVLIVSFGLAFDLRSMRRATAVEPWPRDMTVAHYVGTAGGLLMVGVAANQILLLAIFSPYHEWEAIVFLVLAIQVACVAVGFAAIRFMSRPAEALTLSKVAMVSVLVAAGFLIGAGVVLGPALFVVGAAIAWAARRRYEDPRA